jgi:hypothetical protein
VLCIHVQCGVGFDAILMSCQEDSCCGSQDHETAFAQYAMMRDALNATGRPIYFSLCGWFVWRCDSLFGIEDLPLSFFCLKLLSGTTGMPPLGSRWATHGALPLMGRTGSVLSTASMSMLLSLHSPARDTGMTPTCSRAQVRRNVLYKYQFTFVVPRSLLKMIHACDHDDRLTRS